MAPFGGSCLPFLCVLRPALAANPFRRIVSNSLTGTTSLPLWGRKAAKPQVGVGRPAAPAPPVGRNKLKKAAVAFDEQRRLAPLAVAASERILTAIGAGKTKRRAAHAANGIRGADLLLAFGAHIWKHARSSPYARIFQLKTIMRALNKYKLRGGFLSFFDFL